MDSFTGLSKKIGMLLFVSILLLVVQVTAFADVTDLGDTSSNSTLNILDSGQCTGELKITAVNYVVQNAPVETEVIELRGKSNVSLDTIEIHVLDSNGNSIFNRSLNGKTVSDEGIFLVRGQGESFAVDTHSVLVASSDFIPDNGPGSIAIYDNATDQYCKAINYGGTPTGMGEWTNIGEDATANQSSQGCARSSSNFWDCEALIDNAEPLQTVQIGLYEQSADTVSSAVVIAGFAVTLLGTGLVVRSKKQ